FDYSISIGTIHNRVRAAVSKARNINQTQDLSSIFAQSISVLGIMVCIYSVLNSNIFDLG
ncbi:MAG: hypothetical protein QNJ53_04085, partial [Pleurocapsa sp. MO_192.B19]|nr:hypothetical protein [Pleurocapsa sp. MO_192.B19]